MLADEGLFVGFDAACFAAPSLNAFMAQGRPAWDEARLGSCVKRSEKVSEATELITW